MYSPPCFLGPNIPSWPPEVTPWPKQAGFVRKVEKTQSGEVARLLPFFSERIGAWDALDSPPFPPTATTNTAPHTLFNPSHHKTPQFSGEGCVKAQNKAAKQNVTPREVRGIDIRWDCLAAESLPRTPYPEGVWWGASLKGPGLPWP